MEIYKEMSIHCLKTQTHDIFLTVFHLIKKKFQLEKKIRFYHKDKTEAVLGPKTDILEF